MKLASDSYIQIVEALPTPILLLRQNGIILHANNPAIHCLKPLKESRHRVRSPWPPPGLSRSLKRTNHKKHPPIRQKKA